MPIALRHLSLSTRKVDHLYSTYATVLSAFKSPWDRGIFEPLYIDLNGHGVNNMQVLSDFWVAEFSYSEYNDSKRNGTTVF